MAANESWWRGQRTPDILTPEQKAAQTAGIRRRMAEDVQRTPEQKAEETARLRRECAEARRKHPQTQTPPRTSRWDDLIAGSINSRIECPQCRQAGSVRVKRATQKAGISGGNATGALLTGGLSLFATGLSRKQQVTKARCDNCGSEWTF
jgi:hypothetical protein